MLQGEFRQRLMERSIFNASAGIEQFDKDLFCAQRRHHHTRALLRLPRQHRKYGKFFRAQQ